MLKTAFSYLLANSLVIYVFQALLPNNVVIENSFLTSISGSIWVSFLLIIFLNISTWFIEKLGLKLDEKNQMLIYFLTINSILIWIFSRIPFLTGIGITRFYWAFLLGITLAVIQWFVWMFIDQKSNY